MRIKLIALGNVLMMDDGIAIFVASELEKELYDMGIEVIFGETDLGYCISSVAEEDYLILLDAANFGGIPGHVTRIPLKGFHAAPKGYTQHSYGLLDMLRLYHPNVKGMIFAIEISEVRFNYGLSFALKHRIKDISRIILEQIKTHLEVLEA